MPEDGKLIAPYVEWAVHTDFAYLNGDWFRVLLELNEPAASFAARIDKPFFAELVRIPYIYQFPPREFKAGDLTFCMANMSRKTLTALVTGDGSKEFSKDSFAKLMMLLPSIKRLELGTPIPSPLLRSEFRIITPLAPKPPPAGIVAVIDDGLAFANERFRFAISTTSPNPATRFAYFWNQDDTTTAHQPAGFGYGRELTCDDINSLLSSNTHSGIVDEDVIYRQAGQNLVARRIKHGTCVMDLACGMDPEPATPDSLRLIGVQLPKWVTEETSGGLLTPVVYDAIRYILSRADAIAAVQGSGPLPVVVNLSYGTIAGPHDGSSVFERAIDQLISARPAPLRVVLPAGNHYLARCHAKFEMADATSPKAANKTLRWRVQPDDQAASFMEIWLPELAANQTRPKIAVRITTPTGDTSPWVGPGQDWYWPSANDVRFWAAYFDPAGERPWLLLAMAPTAEVTTAPRTAPSGTWQIEVTNKGGKIAVNGWVQRGDTPFGYPIKGRQSRFDDPAYVRFTLSGHPEQRDFGPSYVRRRGSINALATGQLPVVIGGFRSNDDTPSEYSGAGPVATPQRTGPDAAAIADFSPVLQGVLAVGTRTGSIVAMSGTSIATPQITQLIAETMTSVSAMDRAAVEATAAAADPHPPAPGSTLEERIGEGRIRRPLRPR